MPFVIARAGKPLVKVVPLDTPKQCRRLGFLRGEIEAMTSLVYGSRWGRHARASE
jgi:hypothetical protein